MRICGITAEYNPFHQGHAYQIAQTKQAGATHIVAVMSGNFVQRGTPALLEKRVRTKAALLSGVDLVLELPVPFATASAETFALGALQLMKATGCIQMVSFGAEDSLEDLMAALTALRQERFPQELRRHLQEGYSFAAARTAAVADLAGKNIANLLIKPNNILAVEYLKAAEQLHFSPEWAPVPRKGAAHDQHGAEAEWMSGSYLRHLMERGCWEEAERGISPACAQVYRQTFLAGEAPVTIEQMDRAILSVLRMRSPEWIRTLPDIGEGLENRFHGAIRQAASVSQLYRLAQSKRYPQSRIRRLVLHAFLGIDASVQKMPVPYLRVLGMTKAGETVLGQMKEAATLPVSHSLLRLAEQSDKASIFAQLEASSTDQYLLGMPRILPCGYDLTAPIVKV